MPRGLARGTVRPKRGCCGDFVPVAFAVVLSACHGDPDIPEGPNLAPLARIYDDPTGTLNAQNLAVIAAAAAAELAVIEDLGELEFVTETLRKVDDAVEDYAEERGDDDTGGAVRVDGVARFTTICPGWGIADRLDRQQNGTLNLTLPFRDSRYTPVVFGSFEACQFRVADRGSEEPPRRVELDTAIGVYIGPGVALTLDNLDSTLFDVAGTATIGESGPFPVELDFRILRSGRLETRVPSGDGDVIPFVEDGRMVLGIRAANGAFCCDFRERLCIETQAASCGDVSEGERVLRW